MPVSNLQIQQFSDEQVRTFCESVKASYDKAKHARDTIDDIYQHLAGDPSWSDARTDGPPHMASGNDILAMNTFMADFISFAEGNAQWPIVKKLTVRL